MPLPEQKGNISLNHSKLYLTLCKIKKQYPSRLCTPNRQNYNRAFSTVTDSTLLNSSSLHVSGPHGRKSTPDKNSGLLVSMHRDVGWLV